MQIEQLKHNVQKAITISQEMLQLAEHEDWDALIALEKNRLSIIETTFPIDNLLNREASSELQPLLEQLILLNTELEQVCAAGRDKIKLELSTFSQNQKAVNAYWNN